MKKVIIISTVFIMSLAPAGFALDLDSIVPDLVNTSNGVEGYYFSNQVSGNDATDYAVTTGHTQGGFVYFSGSFTTAIFRKPIAGDKFALTDLLGDPGTNYNAASLGVAPWGEI